MKTISRFALRWADVIGKGKIPRAAAALSYYLTMTVFPLVICLYTLLGSNYAKAIRVLDFAEQFLSAETVRYVKNFLVYVASHYSGPMFVAGLMVLITSSSAAVRSLQATIGDMQGGQRFQGLTDFVFSILASLILVGVMYFAVLVMLTGKSFLELINGYLPFVDISSSWTAIRFIILAGMEYLLFWVLYAVSKERSDRYHCTPGALLSTAGIVVMSWIFSGFIAASARYPLVYGSLASIILLMFWLFLSCEIIFFGASFNIALWEYRGKKTGEKPLLDKTAENEKKT